mgnify:CR=1 FL=1|jgi:hypothetical protein
MLGVFVVLAAASEAGFFTGRWISRRFRKQKAQVLDVDNNVSTITNSSLALLALFLGFTFSSALDHFEKNREAVSNEAVAISAAYELVNLQPEPFRAKLRLGLAEYIDTRLQVADLPNDPQAIRKLQRESVQQQKKLWATVVAMSSKLPEAPLLQPLIESLNGVVSAEKVRTESLINGVPNGLFMPVALFLLFNGVLMGVSLGEGDRRHILLSWGLYFLVALAVGIIVDLDRPLKGFINVDQQAMMLLKDSL